MERHNSLDDHLNGLTNETSRGNYFIAVDHGLTALKSDDLTDVSRKAAVLRNLSAAYDHLGQYVDATETIGQAYDIHNQLVSAAGGKDEKDRAFACYERSATASYVGIYALKAAITKDGDPTEMKKRALAMSQQAQEDMIVYEEVNGLKQPPQYKINMLGRWSMIESLADGDKKRAFSLGTQAVWAARLSEKIDGRKKGLTTKDILRARARATCRGMGALAVNILSRTGQEPRANALALKLL